MSEKEKMINGKLYNAFVPELVELREIARDTAEKYNLTSEQQTDERRDILEGLLGAFGDESAIFPTVKFDYGFNIYIGDRCYINFNATFLDCAEVRIGNDVFVGPNVSFLTPVHPLLAKERNIRLNEDGEPLLLEWAKPIKIEDNVWIGGDVTILPGVTIGHDAVIGAGSVVTKDIPAGVIAIGSPCKVLREITEADSVENLNFDK